MYLSQVVSKIPFTAFSLDSAFQCIAFSDAFLLLKSCTADSNSLFLGLFSVQISDGVF